MFEAADVELDENNYKPWPTTISTAKKVMEHFKAGNKLLRVERKGSGIKDTDYVISSLSS